MKWNLNKEKAESIAEDIVFSSFQACSKTDSELLQRKLSEYNNII